MQPIGVRLRDDRLMSDMRADPIRFTCRFGRLTLYATRARITCGLRMSVMQRACTIGATPSNRA
jgi:hypothetical protein